MSGKIGRNSRNTGKTSSPRSAYEVAILNGFQGTEQQFLDSLVGPQGPQGQVQQYTRRGKLATAARTTQSQNWPITTAKGRNSALRRQTQQLSV